MKKTGVFTLFLAIVLALGAFPAAAAPANPFYIEYDPETMPENELYLHRGAICTFLDQGTIAEAVNALPALKPAQAPSQEPAAARFFRVDGDWTKHIYEIRPGELKYEDKAYILSAEQYKALGKAVNDANTKDHRPYWLIWMNPGRVTEMDYTDATQGLKFANIKKEILSGVSALLKELRVQKDCELYDTEDTAIWLDGRASTRLTFDNDVTYTLYMDKENLYLESSDQKVGCRFKNANPERALEGFMSDMEYAAGGLVNARTGKPVIYLYPETAADVSVTLGFKGKLSTTIPEYKGGWNVTAHPDGTLTDKADGKSYPYLFWDGNAYFEDWDLSRGFCVKAEDTAAFLKEKLPALGLLPEEYAEFIDYWQPRLEKNAYNLIAFSTDEYGAVAPLDVSPAPDTVIRVHMVYRGLDAPAGVPAQKLAPPPARKGFTLVEWGGTMAR